MKSLNIKLSQQLADILSKFAFIISDPVEAPELPPTVNLIIVPYSGPKTGEVKIICDNNLGNLLLFNLIDLDTASDTEVIDALRELGNVFAGNLLTFFYDKQQAFDLKPPIWLAIKTDNLNLNDDWVFLNCEGSILGVSIHEQQN